MANGCNLLKAPSGAFTSQDYSGRTPPKAPRFGGRIGFAYEMPIGGGDTRVELSSDVSHTSSYNYTDTLRPDAVQPGFTKWDAALRVKGAEDRWTVSLIGRNLTSKYVVTAANDIPFAGGSGTGTTGTGVLADMSAFVENPREIFVEVALKF